MNQDKKTQLFSLAESLAGIGHWTIELPENTVFWSDEIYVIHGVTKETHTPTIESGIDFYHPDDRKRVTEFVEQSIKLGKPFEFSLRIIRPSGEIRFVKSKAQCEKNANNEVTSIFGVFQDITEEVESQNLKKSVEIAYFNLIESSSDGFWDWHIEDDYEFMSPRFWKMFGYLPEEKPHKPSAWQDLIFQEDLAVALEHFQKHVETKGEHPYHMEVRYRHKNGSTITVICRGKVIEWAEDGRPIRMIGTHTDITKLKDIENRLRENNDFQKLLTNNNTDLIFVKDQDFKIVSANDAFLNLYPEDIRDTVIGSTTIESYPPDEAELFLLEDKKAFSKGLSEVFETITFPDGQRRTFYTKKRRFVDSQDTPYILCSARDITDIKLTEDALREANNELEEFAYRTSHDLRSPLISSIRLLSFISRDLERGHTDKAISHIKTVGNTLEKLESLVNDILQLSKVKHTEVNKTDVNIRQVIDETLAKFSYLENFDRIQFSVTDDIQENVLTSQELLTQAIENLISNTIKYQDTSKEQSKVSIAIKESRGSCTISISDNGLGIPEDCRDSIFSMFKRFHTKTSFGSGLGLYMIKKSLEKIHGKISYSPLENGSQFTIQIPIL